MERSRSLVGLILIVFFIISLLTNIFGPIVPDIIRTFSVDLGAAGFLVFAFFIAYGVMSIPAGFLVERFREKPVMIGAFLLAMVGSIGFALVCSLVAAGIPIVIAVGALRSGTVSPVTPLALLLGLAAVILGGWALYLGTTPIVFDRARGFNSTRTAGKALPLTLTAPTPLICARRWEMTASAASKICPCVSTLEVRAIAITGQLELLSLK